MKTDYSLEKYLRESLPGIRVEVDRVFEPDSWKVKDRIIIEGRDTGIVFRPEEAMDKRAMLDESMFESKVSLLSEVRDWVESNT